MPENVGKKTESSIDAAIDTSFIAGEALRFIRQNGVSVTEFAEKIAKFQRAHVSIILNHPVPIEKCRFASKLMHSYCLTIRLFCIWISMYLIFLEMTLKETFIVEQLHGLN